MHLLMVVLLTAAGIINLRLLDASSSFYQRVVFLQS